MNIIHDYKLNSNRKVKIIFDDTTSSEFSK